MDNLPTFFARHTWQLDVDEETRQALWDNKLVAIHYPWLTSTHDSKLDAESINPSDYEERNARRAIGALRRLADGGGYVLAQYAGQESVLVGRVESQAEIRLFRGHWGTRSFGDEGLKREAVLKTLRLRDVQMVEPTKHIILNVGRPRQGTLMRWRGAGERVKRLVLNEKLRPSLNALTEAQQEILCSEFLRRIPDSFGFPRLHSLLLPTGRTLKDLDIVGMSETGEQIFAQVTYSSKDSPTGQHKAERLRSYKERGVHLALFCDCSAISEEDEVTFVPIAQVFQSCLESGVGKKWLRLSL